MKILIVEDSEDRMMFFKQVFSECHLKFSSNSGEAISLIDKESFDLIFLDMDLEDGFGRGFDVAIRLKKGQNAYSIVVVHSMNIAVAERVGKILPGTQMIPIVELRRIVDQYGKERLFEILFE